MVYPQYTEGPDALGRYVIKRNDGLVLLTIDPNALTAVFGTGLVVSAAAGTLPLVPDGVTLDALGAGSSLEVAAGGISATQLAAALAGSANGLGMLRVARAEFNPSANSGERTIGAHTLGVTIPQYGFVCGGFFQVNTAFTSAGGNDGTIAISVEAANDIQTAAAVSGAPYSTIGRKAILPKANTPESTGILATAARLITATVAVDALTAGKLTVILFYVQLSAQA